MLSHSFSLWFLVPEFRQISNEVIDGLYMLQAIEDDDRIPWMDLLYCLAEIFFSFK